MSDSITPSLPEPRPVVKTWLVIALVVSVAFNLFALGFIAARALRPRDPHAMHGPFMGPHGLMKDGLGPQGEPMIDKVMARHGQSLRNERGELRQARRAVRDALLSEPFDAAQLERALAALRARTDSSQTRMHEALVELARSLPLEQRKLLARRAFALDAMGMGMGGPHHPPDPQGP